MNDLIDRQDAINAFEPDHPVDWYTTQIIETLESLPSAQPERLTDDDFETIRIQLKLLKRILESGTCNECGIKKVCNVRPEWGEQVRYNCPMFVREEVEE